jgi:hypothetical protein
VSRSHPPELLLESHALLWWLVKPDRLSTAAYGAIADPGNRVHVSARRLGDRNQGASGQAACGP